jgi:hypothetical protein
MVHRLLEVGAVPKAAEGSSMQHCEHRWFESTRRLHSIFTCKSDYAVAVRQPSYDNGAITLSYHPGDDRKTLTKPVFARSKRHIYHHT